MPAKLLSFELLIHAGFAMLLLVFPQTTVRVFGWPQAGSAFWPRMLGSVLAGGAIATLLTLRDWTRDGVGAGFGLAGHISVNMTVAFVLVSMLMLGPDHPTRRGWAFSWLLSIGLVLLSLIEIAYL